MKNQKYIFNSMLLSYNRYVSKLKRLIATGLNFRKQAILEKRIAKLFKKLGILHFSLKKFAALASIVGGFILLQPNKLKAQNFGEPVFNPFGLTNLDFSYHKIVDIDNDGDKDILAFKYQTYYNQNLDSGNYYFENIGSLTNPLFELPSLNPNWLPQGVQPTDFADIDGDGDYDMFEDGSFYRNTGTPELPNFELDQINPFNFEGIELKFADLDTDGDLDAITLIDSQFINYPNSFNYYENKGSSINPIFGEGIKNPFATEPNSYYYIIRDHSYTDIDNDGDLDILAMQNYYGFLNFTNLKYYENLGTSTNVLLAAPEVTSLNLPLFLNNSFYDYVDQKAKVGLADMDNDGDAELLTMIDGSFKYFDFGNYCTDISFFDLYDQMGTDGFTLSWLPNEGSTTCELLGGVVDKRQFTKMVYGNEPSENFVEEINLRANTLYSWKVRCNCEANNELGVFSDFRYLWTGNSLDFGFPKSSDQNMFVDESNIATTRANVKLFPNPAKGSFAIKTDLENYNVELRDITSKLVYTQNNINQTTLNLDIKHIEAGTYFVTINNENSCEVIKLMVY
jgi:Secretion system C-terminal sorting domain/FG-GAP-like repeat